MEVKGQKPPPSGLENRYKMKILKNYSGEQNIIWYLY